MWALFAFVAVEPFVTYARLPATRLYHVSGTGLEGGASRALVFLNFPEALVAIAVLLVLLVGSGRGERALWRSGPSGSASHSSSGSSTRRTSTPAGDRDRRRRRRAGHGVDARGRGAWASRAARALSRRRRPPRAPRRARRLGLRSVHHGHHHGMDGAGNIANDVWLEQVVKRGWSTWEVPDVTTLKASTARALAAVAAVVLWAVFVLPLVRRTRPAGAAAGWISSPV